MSPPLRYLKIRVNTQTDRTIHSHLGSLFLFPQISGLFLPLQQVKKGGSQARSASVLLCDVIYITGYLNTHQKTCVSVKNAPQKVSFGKFPLSPPPKKVRNPFSRINSSVCGLPCVLSELFALCQ